MKCKKAPLPLLSVLLALPLVGCARDMAGSLSASAPGPQAERQDHKLPPVQPSAEFPYESHYATVRGARIHYADVGAGDPVVFIHGNPTSSYLWRNVIPYVSANHRAIALDLIGMGRSDKPAIDYTFQEHFQYVEGFLDALELENVTFVVHDWGATLGFEYARRHPDRVKGIAFMEAVLPPAFPQPSFEAMGEDMGNMFRVFKDPVKGNEFVIDNNLFVEKILPAFVDRPLTEAEMDRYRAPYLDKAARKPLLVWPRQIPIAGEPADVVATLDKIRDYMFTTDKPFLLLYGSPGAVIPPEAVPWYVQHMHNLETHYVGRGLHYLQEDHPEAIGRAVSDWLRRVDSLGGDPR